MHDYSLPETHVSCQPVRGVVVRNKRKSKALDLGVLSSCCLALAAYILTGLHYFGVLAPVLDFFRNLAG